MTDPNIKHIEEPVDEPGYLPLNHVGWERFVQDIVLRSIKPVDAYLEHVAQNPEKLKKSIAHVEAGKLQKHPLVDTRIKFLFKRRESKGLMTRNEMLEKLSVYLRAEDVAHRTYASIAKLYSSISGFNAPWMVKVQSMNHHLHTQGIPAEIQHPNQGGPATPEFSRRLALARGKRDFALDILNQRKKPEAIEAEVLSNE